MDFNSLNFLFLFLPLFLLIYILINSAYRRWYLLISSAIFYYVFQKNNLPFMLGLIAANYLILLLLERNELKQSSRKLLFYTVICANILILLFFKITTTQYWVDTVFLDYIKPSVFFLNLTFPLGLSFITFQILSCLIDSYRKPEKKPNNFLDYFVYLLFFPKIVVGPIEKFTHFENQLSSMNWSWARFAAGSRRFIRGFAKKAIIADQLAVIVNVGFGLEKPAYPTSIAWIVLIAFFLQIYYDFSGYIDMGLGIAQIIGIDLPENFNSPYLSKSLSEFWRRWHMTLTAWFREYVFYPLEYRRRRAKFLRVETDTLIVFVLTGLWHGIMLNYLLWGLLQGVVIVFENSRAGSWIKRLPAFMQHIYLIGVVLVSWVIFRAPSIEFALRFFNKLFVFDQQTPLYPFSLSQPLPIINNSVILIMILGLIGLLPLSRIFELPAMMKIRQSAFANMTAGLGYFVILIVSIAFVISQNYVPSIYGQF